MIDVSCNNCQTIFKVYPKRYGTRKNLFCSKKCEGEFKIKNNPNYIPCDVCGNVFYKKPNKQEKDNHHFCSTNCMGKFREKSYLGENNPNYGNRGMSNSLFNIDNRMIKNEYVWIRLPEHPFCDISGWVREHRVIAEQELYLTDEQTVTVNNVKYLSPKYDVHHKNLNKQDNRPDNFEILTRSEHRKRHIQINRRILKDVIDSGRIENYI